MDVVLLVLGFLLVIAGIIGSFLPVIPGPPTGWVGLLLLHMTDVVVTDWFFLAATFVVAMLVFMIDYLIPGWTSKKFGGSNYGIYGSTIGLIVGLIFTPVGMFLGLFLGAFIGELIHDRADLIKAAKASLGAIIGFFFSTGIKLVVGLVFLVFFTKCFWLHRADFFSWL